MDRLPGWFRQEIPNAQTRNLADFFSQAGVNTICRHAKCPNMGQCFKARAAAFMLLGDTCTRHCRFCNVKREGALLPERAAEGEPERISRVVEALGLDYVVITSVSRDDLEDAGAGIFAQTLGLLHKINVNIKVEVLIPDFCGKIKSLNRVLEAEPFILAHNIETVSRLYQELRPQSDYRRSLEVLKESKELKPGIKTKSSIILGFGEKEPEVISCMRDLRESGCDMLTLGQYLSPSKEHYPVKEYISLEQFSKYQGEAYDLGFKVVLSGPLVRSSYKAKEISGEFSHA